MNRLSQILEVLDPYFTPAARDYPVNAEHDTVIFNVDPETLPPEIETKLNKLGCYFNLEYQSWVMYV